MMPSVDFSSSSKESQRSQAVKRPVLKMCVDPSNASADTRASTGAFSSADMSSAKKATNACSLSSRFNNDSAIYKLCEKMAENHALVGIGEELLKSLEDAGTSKYDAQTHFGRVEEVWQNGHFNYLLFKTLANPGSLLPAMIQELSKQYGQERFEERMSRIKEDHYQYFKSILKERKPATLMRGLLIILITCWSCEDVYPDLDKEKRCTVAVEVPDDDEAHDTLELFESRLSWMKMNGANDAVISALRTEVECCGKAEPREFVQAVLHKIEEARAWLVVEGSPIPELRKDLFVMELAVGLEKIDHKIASMAKLFLDALHSIAIADDGSDVSRFVKEISKIAAEFPKDERFHRALCAKTRRDPFYCDGLFSHEYRFNKRKELFGANDVARAVRVTKDPFCADILEEREGAAVTRAFLIILIGYYIIADVVELVEKYQREWRNRPQNFARIDYETRFAGDVEGLEKVVHLKRLSPLVFKKLRRVQFQREVMVRQCGDDVDWLYRAALNHDGSFVCSYE